MTESEVDTKIANNPGGGNPNPLTENQIAALNVPTASASNKFTTQSDVTGAIAPIKNTYKYFIKVFTSSGSYTVLEKGLYEIRLCGGGSSGGPIPCLYDSDGNFHCPSDVSGGDKVGTGFGAGSDGTSSTISNNRPAAPGVIVLTLLELR